jgi:hypothetical protein
MVAEQRERAARAIDVRRAAARSPDIAASMRVEQLRRRHEEFGAHEPESASDAWQGREDPALAGVLRLRTARR